MTLLEWLLINSMLLSLPKRRLELVLGFAFLQPVTAPVCPYCFGNIPSCTFGADSGAACPAEVVPRENAAIITGSATGALKLAGCLAPRFLRMLSRAGGRA